MIQKLVRGFLSILQRTKSCASGPESREKVVYLTLLRKLLDPGYTIGLLAFDGNYECLILEDTVREKKIKGITAIPYGEYEVVISYSQRFKKQLPILLDVPGFSGVRIHVGNTPKDTHGCLLPGVNWKPGRVMESRKAFNQLFSKIKLAKEHGYKVMLDIVKPDA